MSTAIIKSMRCGAINGFLFSAFLNNMHSFKGIVRNENNINTHFVFFFSLQGFNRIAAITLLFMHEEDAFWCLVFIIEHLMPTEYYSRDKQLIGAQVDQVKSIWPPYGYVTY